MSEGSPPESAPQNEALISTLREGVAEAHQKQPNALGVILFGSRTHPGEARSDSDVDMIPVVQSSKPQIREASREVLREILEKKLRGLKLQANLDGCICVDDIPGQTSSPDVAALFSLGFSTVHMDRNSVFVLEDQTAEQKIREYVKPEEKVWSRRNPKLGGTGNYSQS